ncbi:MAG: glycosyltransferase family 9 protein [Ignavibacteriae bacterium]|nr:glycosyltransferase family 9 protein [Ignavibacteriota bacterium]NOG99841.1 glycosyltransferase family 9 protein [Ignavibacteriota bacterium]
MIKPKSILIVRTDRIGDVVLSLPMAEVIKNTYPNCKVTFLLRNYTKDLLYMHPFVDEVILLEEENGKMLFEQNLNKIKSLIFDTVIVVSPTFKLALLIFLSRIKNRIGTGYRWYSSFFNKKVYEHRKYGTKHELLHNLNLLKNVGITSEISKDEINFNLQVVESSLQKIDDYFAEQNINTSLPIIIVHPGSGGSAVDYPFEKLKKLIKILANELSINIILTGSENERELCSKLSSNEKVINAAGKFRLKELVALVSRSDLMIANSTGPIHIAAALNKFVVGFYPKIPACSQTRWAPFTNKKVIFEPTIDCKECTRKQCEELNCMNSIDERIVFESVKESLQKILNKNIN